jgi:hypothetical protein
MSMRVRTFAEAEARYGAIVAGKWDDEGKWCVLVDVPAAIDWVNSITGKRASRVYCNRDMAQALQDALGNAIARGLASEIKTFDGCFMVRDVRGEPGKPSAHSYALAIDINAATNQLGTSGDISSGLAVCFIDAGFTWGRGFHRQDPMHFSFCGW